MQVNKHVRPRQPGAPRPDNLVALGVETSCDETAAALVERGPGGEGRVLAEAVLSQDDAHRAFGGVVPEVAARAHVEALDRLIAGVMEEAGAGWGDVGAVAATAGPGLIGGLTVGLTMAKAIAWARGLEFVAVNHLEAHALTPRLSHGLGFPYLLLLVSGGHCQLVACEGVGRYARLGSTIDDAAGEAFDKVAKMLGLGFPGGPAVEAAAEAGDPTRFGLPEPLARHEGCNFSFSGLKTAVRQRALELGPALAEPRNIADLAASFQAAAAEHLASRTGRAADTFQRRWGGRALAVAGGVAKNGAVRGALARVAGEHGLALVVPPLRWCTDNAVMVAWAGLERLAQGSSDGWGAPARPRWPLDPDAEPLIGSGAKVKV